MEKDPLKLDFLDWVLKLKFYEKLRSKKGYTQDDLVKVDMMYHLIPLNDMDRKENIFSLAGGQYFYKEEQIKHALFHPPKTTRAAGRFLALKAIRSWLDMKGINPLFLPKTHPDLVEITWNMIRVEDSKFSMPSPLNSYVLNAVEFEKELFAKSLHPEGQIGKEKE